jgi:hypothetical protein
MRLNLVEQVARMLDAEGAYGEWYDNSSFDAEPMPPTPRQNYFRAHYECKAIEILKLLAGQTPENIRADLIEFEKEGWKREFAKRGLAFDQLPGAAQIIEAKYR